MSKMPATSSNVSRVDSQPIRYVRFRLRCCRLGGGRTSIDLVMAEAGASGWKVINRWMQRDVKDVAGKRCEVRVPR